MPWTLGRRPRAAQRGTRHPSSDSDWLRSHLCYGPHCTSVLVSAETDSIRPLRAAVRSEWENAPTQLAPGLTRLLRKRCVLGRTVFMTM